MQLTEMTIDLRSITIDSVWSNLASVYILAMHS
jgi:hypothetical protein